MTDLIRLRVKSTPDNWIEYPDDVARFRNILARAGYVAGDETIEVAWVAFSNGMAAGWMAPYRDDETNLATLLEYLEPEGGEVASTARPK